MKNLYLLIAFAFSVAGCSPADQPVVESGTAKTNTISADTVYVNGKIYTVNEAQPWAEAFAIKNGKFLVIGSADEVAEVTGDSTRVIDLDGQFVMPGIIDPHLHPFEDRHRELFTLNIEDSSTPESILAAVKAYAAANPDKEWIYGGAWVDAVFTDNEPRREILDAVVSDRPVFLLHDGAHSAWLNTKALELTGFMKTRDEDLPEGSVVIRDENGVPSGTIREFALGFARRSMPPFPAEEYIETGREFQKLFHSLGITTVKAAAGTPAHAEAVVALDKMGEWKLRMQMAMNYNYYDEAGTFEQQVEVIEDVDRYVLPLFDPRGFKLFMDGVPPARSGWVINPYPGTDNTGVHYYDRHSLLPIFRMAEELERTVILHATGDRSVREILGVLETIKKEFPNSRLRHHITHNGMIHPDDLDRFKLLGLTVELSPIVTFPRSTFDIFAEVMGQEAVSRYTNPRSVLDAGLNVAVASDYASGPLDPWIRIGWLVSRISPQDPDGGPVFPENAITAEEAIRASTLGSAHVLKLEDVTGSIEIGKAADMIVLDRDITAIPATEIKDTKVMRTVFAGETVYAAK